ncbi:MAG: ribbon-helix-helix protein, CopG family, partial [Caldisericaceae bacterium]|nr:ribbon-helix-helix protein, CopG family [Caldisericaceae bacterium]
MSEERKRLYDLLDSIFDEADRQKSKLEEKKDKAVRYGKFVAFRLPEQIFNDVEKIADKTKKTMSEVIRDALRDFLERNKELID